jgi:uncharacterized membrane protein YgdD (TMEM256/DUF423 family)
MSQLFVIAAGLYGALGVAFAAIAAHTGAGPTLGAASQMMLFHASALLTLGLYGRAAGSLGFVLQGAGLAILLGVALFAGDLTMRQYRGHALFPMAAPSGGTLMIIGWALVLVAGLLFGSRD